MILKILRLLILVNQISLTYYSPSFIPDINFPKSSILAVAGKIPATLPSFIIAILSLMPMIESGAGLNFGMPLGIEAGLLDSLLSIELGFTGFVGFVFGQ